MHFGRSVLRRLTGLSLALVAAVWVGCAERWPQTTFRPVTDFGTTINDLFMNTFWWTMGILVVVQGVLLYVIIRFRAQPDQEDPEPVYGNTKLEIIWTLVPAIIIVFIAVPTVQGIFEVNEVPSDDALIVEVIGHQWWWEFRYPQLGVVTANELHLPVGREVGLVMKSADVIHSFWVPRIGGKRDVNPVPVRAEGEGASSNVNYLTFTIDEPGAYSGVCAEYCGRSHAYMRMRVVAHPREDFRDWVRMWKTPDDPPPGSLAAKGKEAFLTGACIACHAIQGTNAAGQVGPNLTLVGARWKLGAGTIENTSETMARWIWNPQQFKPAAKMPGAHNEAGGFPATGVTWEEVKAIVAYLQSLDGQTALATTAANAAAQDSIQTSGT